MPRRPRPAVAPPDPEFLGGLDRLVQRATDGANDAVAVATAMSKESAAEVRQLYAELRVALDRERTLGAQLVSVNAQNAELQAEIARERNRDKMADAALRKIELADVRMGQAIEVGGQIVLGLAMSHGAGARVRNAFLEWVQDLPHEVMETMSRASPAKYQALVAAVRAAEEHSRAGE